MYIKIILLAALIGLATGCDEDVAPPQPIVKVEFVWSGYSSGNYEVQLKLTNISNRVIYNAYCDVQLIRDRVIVDTAFAYFAGGSNIYPGYTAFATGIFFATDIVYHTDFIRWDCDFLGES